MKRQTKQERCRDLFDTYRCIKKGVPVRRSMAKDSSIPTHPVIPVPDLLERDVLRDCLVWLKQHHVFCNRMNVGVGVLGDSGYHTYGIPGSGDIHGILPNGVHLEIECKAGKGGRQQKNQQKRMEDVRRNKAYYFVVHGVFELEYCFKREGLV